MKRYSIITLMIFLFGLTFQAHATSESNSCYDTKTQGGVDIWPWWVAQPFPWNNIEGYWKLGDDETSYLSAQILSSNSRRKILSLSIHGDGLCSKPYAKGTGYIDASEKNVVRALVSDGIYKYQLKMALFDSRDVIGFDNCNRSIMGVSMQVIGRARRSKSRSSQPLDPNITEMQSMMLKKVSVDVDSACKKINN